MAQTVVVDAGVNVKCYRCGRDLDHVFVKENRHGVGLPLGVICNRKDDYANMDILDEYFMVLESGKSPLEDKEHEE